MKKQEKFQFETPIIEPYGVNKGKVYGYARVAGIGYWNEAYQKDWDNQDCELEDIASFDIENVLLLVNGITEEATQAYRVSHKLGDSMAELIETATLAHMEYVFRQPVEETRIAIGDHE